MFLAHDLKATGRPLSKGVVDASVLMAAAGAPFAALLVALGPKEMLESVLLLQLHREFVPYLKLSVLAYFGVNLVYVVPVAYARVLWRIGRELRFLLCLSLAILAYLLLQPLLFFHHMVLISPSLAILSGIFLSTVFEHKMGSAKSEPRERFAKKEIRATRLAAAFLATTVMLSGGLAAYGLAAQGEPPTIAYAELLERITDEEDFVLAGDPLIASYASRLTPPRVNNLAYVRYPDLTLEDLEEAVTEYDVAVVIVCYRLNDVEGLVPFLLENNYSQLSPEYVGGGEKAVLDLFQKGLGPVSFYVRGDIADDLGLPVA